MIRFEQVSKTYPGGFEALKNVSFQINKGEMIFIAGHSGSGKSTILKLISGITKPTKGKVWFNNQDLGTLSDNQIGFMRQHIGIVFQDHKSSTTAMSCKTLSCLCGLAVISRAKRKSVRVLRLRKSA